MAQDSPGRASLGTTPAEPFANENTKSEPRAALAAERKTLAQKLMNAVQWAERRNNAHALHGNPSVYDNRLFPWVAELESNWTTIRSELARLMMRRDALTSQEARFSPTVGQDRGWTTFVLANYFRANEANIKQCPETWRLVQTVPGLVSVMFSVLEPGARLPAHHGPYNGLLRLHLGLIVPEPREAVAIRIDGEVHHWEEGRALIFDDTFEHEARNESGHTRVVLFIDFERPMKFAARFVNRRLLRSYFFRPFVREGAHDEGRWARRFYREAQALRAAQRAPLQSPQRDVEMPAAPAVESSVHDARSLVEALERDWPMQPRKG